MASVRPAGSVESIELLAQVRSASAPVSREREQPTPSQDTQSDISASGQLYGALAALGDAANLLARPSTWQGTTSTSNDSASVQAVGSSAKVGSYQINVDALAQAQSVVSSSFSSLSTVIGLGTLNIEMGSWNASQTAFATNPNWPKASVNFGPKDHTLEQVRDRINASGVGVVATVVSDATGSRLVLRATSTGQANGFKVTSQASEAQGQEGATAKGSGNPQLDALAFDPSALASMGGAALVQAAQDASVRIEGRSLQSSTNAITDSTTGLSLQAKQVTDDQGVRVDVERDTSTPAKAITELVDRYNQLRQQTSGDASANVRTPEQASVQAVVRTMVDLFEPASPTRTSLSNSLSDIGLRMNAQGLIDIDAGQLTEALTARPQQVQQVLAGLGGKGQDSLSARLMDTLSSATPTASEPQATGAAMTVPAPLAQSANPAGMQFRQRLLEQYMQASGNRAQSGTASAQSEPLSLSENAA